MNTLGFFNLGSLGFPEMLLIAFVGLLIFGKRLPEVGKSLGKGIVEFKKGLSGIEEDVDRAAAPPQVRQAPQIESRNQAPADTPNVATGQPADRATPSA